MSTLSRFARVAACVLPIVLVGSCSSDSTAPADTPTVTLAVSPANLTELGGALTLVATPSGGSVVRVEFYGRHIGADTLSRLGTDSSPPYQLQVAIQDVSENGNWEFVARAIQADGNFVASNSDTATVATVDTRPLQATFGVSQDRITSPGQITFTVAANKTLARIEIDRGDTKVGEALNPTTNPAVVSVKVSATDNGIASYVVKAVDPSGNVVSSSPLTVTIDIRWDLKAVEGGAANAGGLMIAKDPTSSAFYIAVTTSTSDIFLAKVDDGGNAAWTRSFGGPDNEEVGSVTVDPAGRVYVIGWSSGAAPYGTAGSCLVLLYDGSGALLRTQLLTEEKAPCVGAADLSGNVYVAGYGPSSTSATGAQVLTKYDRDGSVIWTQQVGTLPLTAALSIAVDPLDNGVYLGGGTTGSVNGPSLPGTWSGAFAIKFDASGNRLWASQYGIPRLSVQAQGLAADPNGGLYVQGVAYDTNDLFGSADALVLRFDEAGTLAWTKRLDSGGPDSILGIASSSSGVYIVGYIHGDTLHDFTEPTPSTGGSFLAKLAPDGTTQFIRLLYPAILYSAVVTATGDVVAPGHLLLHPVGIARHHDAP